MAEARRVDRLGQAGLDEVADGIGAGVDGIGIEARTHLLQGFIFIGEDGECWRRAVLVDIGFEEIRLVVATPFHDRQLLLGA